MYFYKVNTQGIQQPDQEMELSSTLKIFPHAFPQIITYSHLKWDHCPDFYKHWLRVPII